MVVDDLRACLQAYEFAELLLGGFLSKTEQERGEAIEAATRLRDEVGPRHDAASGSGSYSAADIQALDAARSRLDDKLAQARAHPAPSRR